MTDEVLPDLHGEPPPAWVRNTPIRPREWWLPPMVLVTVAVALAVAARWHGGAPSVAGVVVAVGLVVGAVLLAVAGHRAYVEQSRAASWRLHVTRVVVVGASLLVVTAAGLLSGVQTGILAGVAGAAGWVVSPRPGTPRIDRLVAGAVAAVLAVLAAVLVVIGLTGSIGRPLAAMWIGGGVVIVPVATALAVTAFRRARRGRV